MLWHVRFFSRLVIVGAIVAASALRLAFGQVGYEIPSLEWLLARADTVVRASVTNVVRESAEREQRWQVVTLHVREILKGKRVRMLTFALTSPPLDGDLDDWLKRGSEQLWFLVPNERHTNSVSGESSAATRYPLRPVDGKCPVVCLVDATGPADCNSTTTGPAVLTMDLRILKDPDDILRIARQEVMRPQERPLGFHSISLPRDLVERTGRSGDINSLIVPIDSRLELVAKKLIESPEDFMATSDEYRVMGCGSQSLTNWLRAEGIKALRYFKSKESIALLKGLLSDSSFLVEHKLDNKSDGKRIYFIRREAYATLRDWDVEVEKPLIDEPLP